MAKAGQAALVAAPKFASLSATTPKDMTLTMTFDFDTPIDRRNTHSSKWDRIEQLYGVNPNTGLSMWTADMDYAAAPAITEALAARVAHGVHGYFTNDRPYLEAMQGWMQRRHNWHLETDWVINCTGLVNAFAHCVQAYSEPGEGIIQFTPFYHSFAPVTRANGREIVQIPMQNESGRYLLDMDALESRMSGRERVLAWCSPHNPGGRVWSVEELRQVADFCVKHDLILVSDEIHCDLVFPGHSHTTISNAAPYIADRLVTLVSASKTFNIAGAEFGSAVIPNPELRRKFRAVYAANCTQTALYGPLMAEAAFRHGDAWVDAVVQYLDGNRKFFEAGVSEIAGVQAMQVEATYLSWVDFSGTGMSQDEIHRRIAKDAGIAASSGPSFGPGGENFMRFNFAMTRANIAEAVARLQDAFRDLQ